LTASEVLAALSAQRPSESIRTAIHEVLQRRGEDSLLASFQRDFAS
jgi:hypothetical protein